MMPRFKVRAVASPESLSAVRQSAHCASASFAEKRNAHAERSAANITTRARPSDLFRLRLIVSTQCAAPPCAEEAAGFERNSFDLKLSGKKMKSRQMQTTMMGTSVSTRLMRSKRRCMK
jgi:hypothetical protein